MPSPSRPVWIAVGFVLILVAIGGGYWFYNHQASPQEEWPQYEQYVEAFQVGVAALDADVPQVAEENLSRAIELIPEEPAGWADRGLLYLRTGQLSEAARDLNEANRLIADEPAVQKLLGLLAQREGRYNEAATYLRQAIERDPYDVKSLYRLAEIVDQEHGEGSEAEYQRLMEQILAVQPNNLYVLLNRLRVAVRRSDRDAVKDTLERFHELAPGWMERTREALKTLEAKVDAGLGQTAFSSVLAFSNLLRAEPDYPRSASAVNPNEFVGDSLQYFLKLPPVRHSPPPADMQLAFKPQPLADAPEGTWKVVLPVWLTGEGQPALLVANDQEVRRVGEKKALFASPGASPAIVPVDWNNDFKMDLLLAGGAGLRFCLQGEEGDFSDVTAETGLDDQVLRGQYVGAFAADFDLDGDLDLLLARQSGPPLLARNNFDGTFAALPIFEHVEAGRRFAWADFDHDGVPDAALLDGNGKLHVFANERSAHFTPWPVESPDGRFLALTVVDFNDDGVLDLVALRDDGALLGVADHNKRTSWDTAELARWEQMPKPKKADGEALFAVDLDNNGALDLIASSPEASAAWLAQGKKGFQKLPAKLPPRILASADLRDKGRLDLLALDAEGRPARLKNEGAKNYHWQTVRARAAHAGAKGDNRINSFGIGGDIELRTGTHVVKQPIAAPAVHFGLGERTRSDVVRIEWPNGTSQVEFQTPIDKIVVAEQRLKGSCPFLFAWNGERFDFVTDFMWSTPLGMYINAGDKGGFLQTTDWVKIAGERLRPRDGSYELRVNANLWETHFFDHLALVAVDHPADTELLVDERFFMEPTEPSMQLMEQPRSVAGAWDQQSRDALPEVSADDGVYLDRAGRGLYQGVTNDHWVEFDLGDDVPQAGPLWLIARGWVHPTDSSVNYALEQGMHEPPRGLVLEAPDGRGGWQVVRDKLGFPAGKNKTVLIRLDDLRIQGPDGGGPLHRFRLRTTMEIYWDSLRFARSREQAPLEKNQLKPQTAELRHRGIVAMSQANRSSPELPDYNRIVSYRQAWRDLIGFHTRFGDIGELLKGVDDRYAIVTSGDEIVLRFAAPADPQSGWKRDFIWISDGWVKDGDYNTRFGKMVLPLPSHDLEAYDVAPGHLEDDPVYRRHAEDWEQYHTRYITPHDYEQGLRGFHLPAADRARSSP